MDLQTSLLPIHPWILNYVCAYVAMLGPASFGAQISMTDSTCLHMCTHTCTRTHKHPLQVLTSSNNIPRPSRSLFQLLHMLLHKPCIFHRRKKQLPSGRLSAVATTPLGQPVLSPPHARDCISSMLLLCLNQASLLQELPLPYLHLFSSHTVYIKRIRWSG